MLDILNKKCTGEAGLIGCGKVTENEVDRKRGGGGLQGFSRGSCWWNDGVVHCLAGV